MSKSGFSIADLQQGAKKLHSSSAKDESPPRKPDSTDSEAEQQLEELYARYEGDLDRIFRDLNADPSKAKKPHHRPKDGTEFATKYLAGYYSLVEDEIDTTADSKSSHK